MQVQVEFWQLVLLLVAFFGGVGGMLKYIFGQHKSNLSASFQLINQHLDTIQTANKTSAEQLGERLKGIEEANKKEADQWQRVERELMELKAELPLNYVRREDYIRGQSIIEAKLDGLAIKIENSQLRGLLAKKE